MEQQLNVLAKIGTYKDEDGEKKSNWAKVGVTTVTRQGGVALKIDTLPVNFDGWLYLATPSDDKFNS